MKREVEEEVTSTVNLCPSQGTAPESLLPAAPLHKARSSRE